MSGKTFAVVFSGKLVEGASVERVKQNVAKLFKVEVTKIERLFSGARVAVKKGIDEATAKKYQLALRKAGAICAVVDLAKAAGTAAASAKVKPSTATAPGERTTQATRTAGKAPPISQATPEGVGLPKSVVKPAPKSFGELKSATVDEPGVVLVRHRETPPPQIDTAGLSVDQPGAVLTEHEDVPEPVVDIRGISMAEAGADIGTVSKQRELDVDISGLSMDEPGVILVKSKEEPEPRIDISKLSVE
jgi:hypothetical protein